MAGCSCFCQMDVKTERVRRVGRLTFLSRFSSIASPPSQPRLYPWLVKSSRVGPPRGGETVVDKTLVWGILQNLFSISLSYTWTIGDQFLSLLARFALLPAVTDRSGYLPSRGSAWCLPPFRSSFLFFRQLRASFFSCHNFTTVCSTINAHVEWSL